MKKFAAIAAIAMMASAPVFAAEGGFSGPSATPTQTQNQTQPGGFVDNSVSPTTAAKAKDLKDDSWVKLRATLPSASLTIAMSSAMPAVRSMWKSIKNAGTART